MQSLARIMQLLLREQWRGGAGVLGVHSPLVAGLPATEIPLVHAAAALGAGEPKRALRALGPLPAPDGDQAAVDRAAVDRALRRLAWTLEHNWFPGGGGAVLEPGRTAGAELPAVAARTPDAALVVDVAGFLSGLPTSRTIAAGIRRGAAPPGSEVGVAEGRTLLARLQAAGAPMAVGPVALALSDLYVRSGRFADAAAPWGTALEAFRAAGDPVGMASCLLVDGDWSADPLAHPELLGLDLEWPDPDGPAAVGPDPRAAAGGYAEADRLFGAAGAVRGAGAVALRRSALALRSGNHPTATRELDRCRALAEEAGDGALARLAGVHRALVAVDAGADVDADGVAEDVGTWAITDGSRSYARGLARLCHATARRLRADVRRARRALLVAEAINDRIGAVTEPALVRRELVEQYGSANYRRAALELTLLDLADHEAAPPPTDLEWARLVDLGIAADRDASGLMDPDAMERVHRHLLRISGSEPDGGTGHVRIVLDQALGDLTVMIPLYRGTRARGNGDLAEAERRFAEALAVARGRGGAGIVNQITVLGTMRRFPEAVAIVEMVEAMRPLEPDILATLYTRLERPDLALPAIDRLNRQPLPPGTRPWERPGLRAEALVGLGRPAEALPFAERALAAFERHLASLARDVLRTMASDEVSVAGHYTTAIRAHADLHAAGAGTGHLDAAFALSDRCRGMSLADLVDLDRGAGDDPAVVAAVRAWQRAGAGLARTIERLGDLPAVDARRLVRTAERTLDETEDALVTLAPALVTGPRPLPATPSLDEIRERLEPGTLLVQYHAFDDQLIAWAVTRDSARMVRAVTPTSLLVAQVRRFHDAVADPASTSADRTALGDPLTGLLLAPLSDELATHRRVVIVPHGALAALPFHVLPRHGSDLAATHVVSYLPAANMVPDPGRRRRVGAGADTLVVGDPTYRPGRPQLPGAAVEAAAIAGLRGTPALLGDAARRDVVLRRLETADVVHLATHGSLFEAAPYSAELELVGGANLTVPDLMGLDSRIALAVLSACDSGRGRATAAGDVIGLTRALTAAGADELVVSLWPVDDRLACLTMVALHEQLLGGASPAEALSAAAAGVRTMEWSTADMAYRTLAGSAPAALRVRSARKIVVPGPAAPAGPPDPGHPYYWAPFVHVGV